MDEISSVEFSVAARREYLGDALEFAEDDQEKLIQAVREAGFRDVTVTTVTRHKDGRVFSQARSGGVAA